MGHEHVRVRALEHDEPRLHRAANEDWQPADPGEVLIFGRHQSSSLWSLDGVIDQLRISNGRRYEGDFSPHGTARCCLRLSRPSGRFPRLI